VHSRFRRLSVRSEAWQHGRLSTGVNPFPLYRVAFQRNKLRIYTEPHMGRCSSVVVTPSIIGVTLSSLVQLRVGLRLETVAIVSRPMQKHQSTIREMQALRAVTVMRLEPVADSQGVGTLYTLPFDHSIAVCESGESPTAMHDRRDAPDSIGIVHAGHIHFLLVQSQG